VIHGAQPVAAQEIREFVGVGLVRFVPAGGVAAPVTNDDALDLGREEVIEPLGLRAFLERHVDRPAHPAEVLEQGRRFGRDDTAGDDPSTVFAHRDHGGSLMDVEANVFRRAFHESRSWRWSMGGWHLHGSRKGRALNIRQPLNGSSRHQTERRRRCNCER
jgi:hypothetical protein